VAGALITLRDLNICLRWRHFRWKVVRCLSCGYHESSVANTELHWWYCQC